MRMKSEKRITKVIVFLVTLFLLIIPFNYVTFAESNVYSSKYDGLSFEKTKSYYYDQLNANEKQIYDKVNQCTWEQHSFSISKNDVDNCSVIEFYNLLISAYTAYELDHPENTMIFDFTKVAEGVEEIEESYHVNLLLNQYGSVYKYEKAETKLHQIVNGVKGTDSYTKLLYLWNYFLDNSQYEFAIAIGLDTEGKAHEYDHSPYGLLLGYSSVCEGYAYVGKMLCDELSIPCLIVGNNGHAWNYVEMENGKWYAVDFSANYPRDWYDIAFLMGSENEVYRNNNNFHLSDLVLVKEGKFVFPLLSQESYIYQQPVNIENYKMTLEQSGFQDKEIEFLYEVNQDGKTCTITDYEGERTTDLVIPGELDGYTVTQIGVSAFSNCIDLEGTVSLPDTVTKIDNMAFMQCKNLKKIELPDSVSGIGIGVFMACPNLTEVSIGSSLDRINDFTFANCISLQSVTLNNKIRTIGNSAFGSCENLKTIALPVSLQTIGNFAFSNDRNLQSIILPDSLEVIGTYAFRNTALKHVSIGKGVNLIGEAAFAENTMLESINVDVGNEKYYSLSGILYNHEKTMVLCVPPKVEEVVLPEELEVITESCFSDCKNLKSVTISKNVKEIQILAFNCCEGLTEFKVDPENSNYTVVDGVLFSKDLKKLVLFPNAKKSFTNIPKELETIGAFAFYSSAVEEIDLSAYEITKLEEYAFDDAYMLSKVVLPDTIETIPNGCFYFCGQLKEIYLGSKIKTIEDSAFESAGALETVYFNGSKEQWAAITMGKNNSNIQQCRVLYDGQRLEPADSGQNDNVIQSGEKESDNIAQSGEKKADNIAQSGEKESVNVTQPEAFKFYVSSGIKIKAGKSKVQITAKKKEEVSGFEVRYKTGSKKWKTVTAKGNKNLKLTIKKLKKNQKYKVQVRAYFMIGDSKKYSSWSKSKTVKVK